MKVKLIWNKQHFCKYSWSHDMELQCDSACKLQKLLNSKFFSLIGFYSYLRKSQLYFTISSAFQISLQQNSETTALSSKHNSRKKNLEM